MPSVATLGSGKTHICIEIHHLLVASSHSTKLLACSPQGKLSANIYLSCDITFLAEMLSQPVSEQQKQSEVQSPSMSEEGSAGIRSAREETAADNTEDPSVDLLANGFACKIL